MIADELIIAEPTDMMFSSQGQALRLAIDGVVRCRQHRVEEKKEKRFKNSRIL